MSHLDAAALVLAGLASVTTAVLFALHRLRHRPRTGAETAEATPKA
jgi:hypothetical protein